MSLEEAERVPRALADEYAGSPASPLDLARALRMQPNGGSFRMLVGASAGYQLTEGSAWADSIALTTIGKRITRPTEEGEDVLARREALMKPKIARDFLTKYKDGKVPREDIAYNLLEGMGVPPQETKRVFGQIVADARRLGYLTNINGVEYVQLSRPTTASSLTRPVESPAPVDEPQVDPADDADVPTLTPVASTPVRSQELKRVYISHGTNRGFVEVLKDFLGIVDVEARVSVERHTSAIPVPEKIIEDMRSCDAAIVHVEAEKTLKDDEGNEHVTLNENVLIEIGAAMAMYGKRYVLLVREGVKLPSDLQGLAQIRYAGDKLDASEAVKLLKAVADMKTRPLPTI
jgi:predicted nucleotide-binding protein